MEYNDFQAAINELPLLTDEERAEALRVGHPITGSGRREFFNRLKQAVEQK